jgi:hypothetical protein
VNGTSGEGCAQSFEERKAVAEAWVKAALQGQTVVVQVGGGPLPDVLALVRTQMCLYNAQGNFSLSHTRQKSGSIKEAINNASCRLSKGSAR